jgi:hypothetical protein
MACPKCEAAQLRAKAAGHRDWRESACFDCAGVNIDEYFASIGFVPDEKLVARELAKMNAQRREPAEPVAPAQLSLFG